MGHPFRVAAAKAKGSRGTNTGRIKLYTVPISPPCRSVMMVARALGLELDIVVLDITHGEQRKPEFLKINPTHSVPTIDDNGFILWESPAIMAYFVNAYGKNDALYPKNPQLRAVIDQRLYFDRVSLYLSFLSHFMPSVLKGGEEKENYGEKSKLEEALGFLDIFFSKTPFVAGEHLSIADIAIVVTISNVEVFGYDLSPFKNINKWYERTKKALAPHGYVEINENGAKKFVESVYGIDNIPSTYKNTTSDSSATKKH